MSPFLLALAIQDIISAGPQTHLNLWYLDDGALMGSPTELEAAMQFLVRSRLRPGPSPPSGALPYPPEITHRAGAIPMLSRCSILPFLEPGSRQHMLPGILPSNDISHVI